MTAYTKASKTAYMRRYMRWYRASYPERELASLVKALAKPASANGELRLWAEHHGVVSFETLTHVTAPTLTPDVQVMLREEIRLALAL